MNFVRLNVILPKIGFIYFDNILVQYLIRYNRESEICINVINSANGNFVSSSLIELMILRPGFSENLPYVIQIDTQSNVI